MPSNTAGMVEGSPSDWSFKTTNLQGTRDHCTKDGSFLYFCNIHAHTAVEADQMDEECSAHYCLQCLRHKALIGDVTAKIKPLVWGKY